MLTAVPRDALMAAGALLGITALFGLAAIRALLTSTDRRQTLSAMASSLGTLAWMMRHLLLVIRYNHADHKGWEGHMLTRYGWRPQDARLLFLSSVAHVPPSTLTQEQINAIKVAHFLHGHLVLVAPALSAAAFRSWAPHLHLVWTDTDVFSAYALALEGNSQARAEFGAVLTAWHEAAGPLLGLCIEAGLSRREAAALQARGDLTEESVRVLRALVHGASDESPLALASA